MNYNFDHKVLEKAILNYGTTAQKIMLVEEMAVLQKEVCKELRGSFNILKIAEEMADVYVMLEQLKMICGINEGITKANISAKINRLKERMESEEN